MKAEYNRNKKEGWSGIAMFLLILLLSEDVWRVTILTFCNFSSHATFVSECVRVHVCVCVCSCFLF